MVEVPFSWTHPSRPAAPHLRPAAGINDWIQNRIQKVDQNPDRKLGPECDHCGSISTPKWIAEVNQKVDPKLGRDFASLRGAQLARKLRRNLQLALYGT